MPTYEYVCEKCGHQFDHFQSITESALTTCPKDRCGQKKWGKGRVKKMISGGAGLLFKGSGFYITDYRSDKYQAAAKKDSGASSSATTGASAGASTTSSGGDGKSSTAAPNPAKATAKPAPAAKAKS